MSMQRASIKNQIDVFCSSIFAPYIETGELNWSLPILIPVFLGNKSKELLMSEIVEASTTILTVQPIIRPVYIDIDGFRNADSFYDQLVSIYDDLRKRGIFEGGNRPLEISYISIMHDPYLNEMESVNSLKLIRKKVEILRSQGISILNSNFYGIFDRQQIREIYNYRGAFSFVREGKQCGLWGQIFHLEKNAFEDTYEKECRAIIARMIYDYLFQDGMGGFEQESDFNHYAWRSLGLEELKIPEQMVCNILINGFRQQLRETPIDQTALDNFSKELGKLLANQIKECCSIMKCDKLSVYIPQRLENYDKQSGRKKSRLNEDSFENRILSSSALDTLTLELLKPAREIFCDLTSNEVKNIFLQALSAFYYLDVDTKRMAEQIRQKLLSTVDDLERASRKINLSPDVDSMDEYRMEAFSNCAENKVFQLAAELLLSYYDNPAFVETMKDILDSVKQDNQELMEILDGLRIGQYGGNKAIALPVIVKDYSIPLTASVPNACKRISKETIDFLVNDTKLVKDILFDFVNRAQINIDELPGALTRDFGITDPGTIILLSSIQIDLPGIISKQHSCFRNNTLVALLSKEWGSQSCLSEYYEEEQHGN
ncbi:MAG: hypothetical protein LUI87_13545 [Lachnospiraceae bacterium]|nr:hypothetical protein [Lachnospiraceae bacterium]